MQTTRCLLFVLWDLDVTSIRSCCDGTHIPLGSNSKNRSIRLFPSLFLRSGLDTAGTLQRELFANWNISISLASQHKVYIHADNVVKLLHDALSVCKQHCVVTQVVWKKNVTHLVCQLPYSSLSSFALTEWYWHSFNRFVSSCRHQFRILAPEDSTDTFPRVMPRHQQQKLWRAVVDCCGQNSAVKRVASWVYASRDAISTWLVHMGVENALSV